MRNAFDCFADSLAPASFAFPCTRRQNLTVTVWVQIVWHGLRSPSHTHTRRRRSKVQWPLDMQISSTRAAKRCTFSPRAHCSNPHAQLMSYIYIHIYVHIYHLFVSFRGCCHLLARHTLNCFLRLWHLYTIHICSARRTTTLSFSLCFVAAAAVRLYREWVSVSDSQPSDDYATCITKSVVHAPKAARGLHYLSLLPPPMLLTHLHSCMHIR